MIVLYGTASHGTIGNVGIINHWDDRAIADGMSCYNTGNKYRQGAAMLADLHDALETVRSRYTDLRGHL